MATLLSSKLVNALWSKRSTHVSKTKIFVVTDGEVLDPDDFLALSRARVVLPVAFLEVFPEVFPGVFGAGDAAMQGVL